MSVTNLQTIPASINDNWLLAKILWLCPHMFMTVYHKFLASSIVYDW